VQKILRTSHSILALSSLALCAALIPGVAQAQPRSAAAHVHGSSELTVARAGSSVELRFVAPGSDIVGFERSARSDDERASVKAALEKLEAPLGLFVFPANAACTVEAVSASFGGESHEHDDDDHEHDEGDDHEHDHDDDDHDHDAAEGGHAEFAADYRLNCAQPGNVSAVTFAIFEQFPAMQSVAVQFVMDGKVGRGTVTRASPVQSF
jgi:hypothetical protein